MIPIAWSYLLRQYIKVFLLTTSSFILILFVTRLKEIAKIVSMTPEPKYVFLFMLNIIPFMLPIAIPIASLLSAILLYSKLSSSQELTALRSCGFSLANLTFPVLATAFFLAICNFFVVSELTSHSKIFSKRLVNHLLTQNPLYLLEKKGKLKMKDFYVDMMIEERGKIAHNFFFIAPNKTDTRLNLVSIKTLNMERDKITAPSVNIITSVPSKEEEGFDHLVIENEKNITASAQDLSKLLKSSHFHLYTNHLTLPQLRLNIKKLKSELDQAKIVQNEPKVKKTQKKIAENHSEIIMRISIGLSVWTFTLLGISYAIEIGRNRKFKNLLIISSLTLISLICLFTGKVFMNHLLMALFIYFFPHLVICLASFWNLFKISKGIEA